MFGRSDGYGSRPTPLRGAARTLGGLALGGVLALAGVAGVFAQGTPETGAGMMASPASGDCIAPDADTTGLASPAADAADAMATPGDTALLDEAVAAATNLAICWNAGDLTGVLASVTPNLLQTKFNVADAAEAEEALAGMELPPYSILEVGEVNTYDDGRASLDIIYLLGDYQYVDARWYMVRAGDAPGAEAIYVGCTSLRTAHLMERLEDAVGKPVVTANGATVWQGLRLMGLPGQLAARGALFRL